MPTRSVETLESIALLTASVTAIIGVSAWRRQLRGKRRYELAEEVLALFYEAQDAIRYIRTPLGWSGEGSSRKPGPNESPEVKEALDRAYVVFERYRNSQETFNRLHALRYRFMAVFGKDYAHPFDDLREVLDEVFLAARMLSALWDPRTSVRRTEAEQRKHYDELRKYEAVFWEMTDSDAISNRVHNILLRVEGTCAEIVGGYPSSWRSAVTLQLQSALDTLHVRRK